MGQPPVCLSFSLAMCGKKDGNNNTLANSTLWDANSVKFETSSFGGTGPTPAGFGGEPSNIKCQKDSYTYSYDSGLLTKSVCNDATVGRQDVNKTLSTAEIAELQIILGNIQFSKKSYSGEECVADGGGTPGGFIQIYQTDGVVKIADTLSDAPCGEDSGKYLHGQIENFEFLNQVDTLLN